MVVGPGRKVAVQGNTQGIPRKRVPEFHNDLAPEKRFTGEPKSNGPSMANKCRFWTEPSVTGLYVKVWNQVFVAPFRFRNDSR